MLAAYTVAISILREFKEASCAENAVEPGARMTSATLVRHDPIWDGSGRLIMGMQAKRQGFVIDGDCGMPEKEVVVLEEMKNEPICG